MRRVLLSALGIGFLPKVPGTWASLATVVVLVAVYGAAPAPASIGVLLAVGLGSLVTLSLGGATAKTDGEGDPPWVVTDEVAGQALALGIGDLLSKGSGYGPAVAAFVLFRVFDIFKPGPIRAAERWPGGLGILADDLLAGVAAGSLVLAARAAGLFGS